MSLVIDYIEKKRNEMGIKSQSALARLAWPQMGENAPAYWKRLRAAAGYEKPQRLQYEDLRSLCAALGLDVLRVQYELDQLEKGKDAPPPSE